MSVTSARLAATAVIAAALYAAACHSSGVSASMLPTARGLAEDTFGVWTRITAQNPSVGAETFMGELIAVTSDSVFLLTDDSLTVIPAVNVASAQLETFGQPQRGTLSWMWLGSLSTLSQGWLSLVMSPLWWITGTSVYSAASWAPHYGTIKPETVAKFARFPQGIPAALDRRVLKPRGAFVRARS